jgi:saccharopine dehydrogenase-like NADP-dependent oxidoreductase
MDWGARVRLVTVLGGYGVFGSRIAAAVSRHPMTRVRIVGRTAQRGERFAAKLGAEFRSADLSNRASLKRAIDGSFLVVHAAGPFQHCDYRVAECCIDCRCHYLDIADARHFVSHIVTLDARAREFGLFVSAGASSVPAITHSMISELRPAFQKVHEIQIALSPGNRNPRGPSTIAAILSYVGRPIRVWKNGHWELVTGWGQAERVRFPAPINWRVVYDCDAPDVELFPSLFGASCVHFQAGLELSVLNGMLAGLARLRRLGLLSQLPRYASLFARASQLLLPFGTRNGALGVWLRGTDHAGRPTECRMALVTDCDGPAIPVAPAILLIKRLLDHKPPAAGAFPCLGFVTLPDLTDWLSGYRVWLVRDNGNAGSTRAIP